MDFDFVDDWVYWLDVVCGLIVSVYFNVILVKILFCCNVKNFEGLVIDYVGWNIYWIDIGINRIEVGWFDGMSRKLLIKDGFDKFWVIFFDERNGWVNFVNLC